MPRDPRDLSVSGAARSSRRVAELEDQKDLIRLRVGSGPAGADGQSFRGHEALALTTEVGAAPGELVNRLTFAGTGTMKKLNAGATDQVIIIQKTGAGTLTIKKENNLKIASEFVLSENDTIMLIYDSANWIEIGRANN